jgi:hypothetical protein
MADPVMFRLATFAASLHSAIMQAHATRRTSDVRLASQFNIFDYIRPNENALSDILVDLLSPAGTHGQGSRFLRQFLIGSGIGDPGGLDTACVKREVVTSHIEDARRIDFTIEIDGLAVGVENKPWAGDQVDQLNDYVEHLSRRYGDRFVVVYLSGDGSKPTSLSPDRRESLGSRFRQLNYPTEVRAWLEACRDKCQADSVGAFLNDFIVYLDETFQLINALKGYKGPMARQRQDNNVIVQYVLQDTSTLEVAMACARAFPEMAVAVCSSFTTALEERLSDEGGGQWIIHLQNDADGGPDGERIAITKGGWGRLRVVLAHDKPIPVDKVGVYVQVRDTPVNDPLGRGADAEELRTRLIPVLNARCGKGDRVSAWWPEWYRYLAKYSRWDDPDVLLELHKKQEALDCVSIELIKVMRSVEEVLTLNCAS